MIHPNGTVDECMEEISALEREIERLQADLQSACTQCDMLRLEIKDNELYSERLREALQRIASGGEVYDSAAHLMQIARRALEGKK